MMTYNSLVASLVMSCDMGVSQNISGLKRDGPGLAIAPEVLTRRSLRRGARYGHKPEHKWP